MEVEEDAGDSCHLLIDDHEAFYMWNTTNKDTTCDAAAVEVMLACLENSDCDRCASMTAYIYKTYEAYVNELYASMFTDYETTMFNTLENQNEVYQQAMLNATKEDI